MIMIITFIEYVLYAINIYASTHLVLTVNIWGMIIIIPRVQEDPVTYMQCQTAY